MVWLLARCLAGLTLLLSPALALPPLLAPLDGPTGPPPRPWHLAGLPKQQQPATTYTLVPLDGRTVLQVRAERSYGNLVHPLPHETFARQLAWRWRLDEPLARADLRERQGDDSAVKVCALFDLPDRAVPFFERQLLKLARLRSGEPLPAATVCYVWDPSLPAGTRLDNAYTRRLRYVVLRGAGEALHQWAAEQRDLHADFLALFGDEAREVPPLLGVAVAADADNTQGRSLAHVSDLTLE